MSKDERVKYVCVVIQSPGDQTDIEKEKQQLEKAVMEDIKASAPAKTPCKYRYGCHDASDVHSDRYSHPSDWKPRCMYGSKCYISDWGHRERFYHENSKPKCSHGYRCYNDNHSHAHNYSHPSDWRPVCLYKDKCKSKNISHFDEYYHKKSFF